MQKEEVELNKDFINLLGRFPHKDYALEGTPLQEEQMGNSYRGLSPLTLDQEQLIRDTKTRLRRNIAREATKAQEREKNQRLISRFGSWLIDFADSLTPIFSPRP